MRFAELIPLLQVGVGPVILISGIGLILLSMTNRFGRVTDRTHQGGRRRTPCSSRRSPLHAQIQILRRRTGLLRVAVILAVASVFSAAALVVTIF
jgi:hypothetical protein